MSVSMTMNGAVLPVLAMFIVAGEEQVFYIFLAIFINSLRVFLLKNCPAQFKMISLKNLWLGKRI